MFWQLWSQIVPVVDGSALSIAIILNASSNFPSDTKFTYSGICWLIGHPASLQGEMKQSNRPNFESVFNEATFLADFTWCLSFVRSLTIASNLSTLIPENFPFSNGLTLRANCCNLSYPPGLRIVVATVIGWIPTSINLSMLK